MGGYAGGLEAHDLQLLAEIILSVAAGIAFSAYHQMCIRDRACIGWLRNQTALIRPKIIVCLGRIAAAKIIKPDIKITKEHGVFCEKNGVVMMATLHPAALLRNPSQKPGAFDDFLKLREKIHELCDHTYEEA